MGRCVIDGIDELCKSMESLAALPDHVVDDMLNAEADIILPEQKRKIRSLWRGPFSKGMTEKSLVKGKIKLRKKERVLYLTFDGETHGNRNTEIAFINEFGKTKQVPRPALLLANEEKADAAVNAAAQILENWMNQNF